MKRRNLYGCTEGTLDSLLLTLLPKNGHGYIPLQSLEGIVDDFIDPKVYLLKILLHALRRNAGFRVPKVGCMSYDAKLCLGCIFYACFSYVVVHRGGESGRTTRI